MHKGSGLLIFSLAAVVLPANGQAQKPASKTYVLKAARMFDGKSNALATPGLVVVTDGKITAVGAKAFRRLEAEHARWTPENHCRTSARCQRQRACNADGRLHHGA